LVTTSLKDDTIFSMFKRENDYVKEQSEHINVCIHHGHL
jgi:hypothetical protein